MYTSKACKELFLPNRSIECIAYIKSANTDTKINRGIEVSE